MNILSILFVRFTVEQVRINFVCGIGGRRYPIWQ